MKKQITSAHAPAAIGPYSQAVQAGPFVFTSGQLPIDPKTGAFAGSTIEEQTRQSLKNIEAVLKEAGLTMDAVVKTTVFLSDMNNFTAMNGVYAEFSSGRAFSPPVRRFKSQGCRKTALSKSKPWR